MKIFLLLLNQLTFDNSKHNLGAIGYCDIGIPNILAPQPQICDTNIGGTARAEDNLLRGDRRFLWINNRTRFAKLC